MLSSLRLKNCQIKSAKKLRKVCDAIDILEIETFIKSGRITLANVFVCPDIDLMPFVKSNKPTERLIGRLCMILHCKRYGKNAEKRYRKYLKK